MCPQQLAQWRQLHSSVFGHTTWLHSLAYSIVPIMAGMTWSIVATVIQGYQLDSSLKVHVLQHLMHVGYHNYGDSSRGLMHMALVLLSWPWPHLRLGVPHGRCRAWACRNMTFLKHSTHQLKKKLVFRLTKKLKLK